MRHWRKNLLVAIATDNENGRLSRLELAHGGTLFLEKIEYLAVELQSALLQVIKQGCYHATGCAAFNTN